jgi:hypothetical protein
MITTSLRMICVASVEVDRRALRQIMVRQMQTDVVATDIFGVGVACSMTSTSVRIQCAALAMVVRRPTTIAWQMRQSATNQDMMRIRVGTVALCVNLRVLHVLANLGRKGATMGLALMLLMEVVHAFPISRCATNQELMTQTSLGIAAMCV